MPIYELAKEHYACFYFKCSRCGFRAPVRPGDGFAEKIEAEQAERAHNLTAHGIAPKGFKP